MNLLSVNLLLLLCAAATGLVLWLSMHTVRSKQLLAGKRKKKKAAKKKSKKQPKKEPLLMRCKQQVQRYRAFAYSPIINAFGGGLVVALAAATLLQASFPSDQLPGLLWLMFLPAGVALIYMVASIWQGKWTTVVAAATLVICMLFSALLINRYYGYYTSVASIFGKVTKAQTITLHAHVPSTKDSNAVGIVENSYEPASSQVEKGKIYSVEIPGATSHFEARPALTYVPPAGLEKDGPALPVLILLAGSPGDPADWIYGGGLEDTLNEFAARHKGLAPVVVVADHNGSHFADTECLDSPRGNAETYLAKDIPAYIKSTFNVSAQPQDWAIGGLSDGGMCGLMLTLTHPETFKTFLDFGGETNPEIGSKDLTVATLFGGSFEAWTAHDPMTLLQAHRYPDIGGWFGVGDSDKPSIVAGEKNTYQLALKAGVDANIELVPGGQHTFYVWRQNFQDSLPWLSNRMGLTLCETRCQQN